MKNKIVRRLLTMSLCAALAFGLMACGNKDKAGEENDGNTTQEPEIMTPDEVIPDDETEPNEGLEEDQNDPVDEVGEDVSPLSEEMNLLMENVSELPALGEVILEEENFEYYSFIPYIDGAEALASDALIGSIAHSVVLIRLPEGTDAADIAAQIEEKANPSKWICVTAEKVAVVHNEDTVLLVMSNEAATDAIVSNFNAIYAE